MRRCMAERRVNSQGGADRLGRHHLRIGRRGWVGLPDLATVAQQGVAGCAIMGRPDGSAGHASLQGPQAEIPKQ
jgi:hypothetical protein